MNISYAVGNVGHGWIKRPLPTTHAGRVRGTFSGCRHQRRRHDLRKRIATAEAIFRTERASNSTPTANERRLVFATVRFIWVAPTTYKMDLRHRRDGRARDAVSAAWQSPSALQAAWHHLQHAPHQGGLNDWCCRTSRTSSVSTNAGRSKTTSRPSKPDCRKHVSVAAADARHLSVRCGWASKLTKDAYWGKQL